MNKEQTESLSPNVLTLRSYEAAVQEYISGTAAEVSGSFKSWIDQILTLLSSNAQIIEIGSGFGRDASYIESFGFKVERTDATESFVTFLREQRNSARKFNILTDAFCAQYDLVFANAVFLHFTPEELELALIKIHGALKNNGILAFSVKKGKGAEWTTAKLGKPRYFCYWESNKMLAQLKRAGFEIILLSEDERFLQLITKPTR